VAREFVPFDGDAIDAEVEALKATSAIDWAKLAACIERYEEVSPRENPKPAMIESFEEGFLELRHFKGEYKGRLLFYVAKKPKGTEDLVMLVVFRKQTQKTPKATVALAVKRMKADMERRKQKENR
jgi:phage-related protein